MGHSLCSQAISILETYRRNKPPTLVLGVAVFILRLAADDLGGGTAVSCRRCSTAAASVATISMKRSIVSMKW